MALRPMARRPLCLEAVITEGRGGRACGGRPRRFAVVATDIAEAVHGRYTGYLAVVGMIVCCDGMLERDFKFVWRRCADLGEQWSRPHFFGVTCVYISGEWDGTPPNPNFLAGSLNSS
jgi:hypothetical protein